MKYLSYMALTGYVIAGCIEFRMSDEEAKSELLDHGVNVIFKDLKVEGQNIHYVYTAQSKNTLAIFVHGSPGSWNAFIDFFKTDSLLKDMDILAMDRPGFGNSDYGHAEPSLEKQASYLNKVANNFSHPRKILIGHSLGGAIIARMAVTQPKSYDGLIFVAASIDPDMEKDEWYRRAIDSRVGGWLTPKDFEVSNDEILPLKKELESMKPLWREIMIPSIVIHGTKDSLVPVENVDFAIAMLKDSLTKIQLIEGANHFIPWTHPEEIIKAIRQMANVQ